VQEDVGNGGFFPPELGFDGAYMIRRNTVDIWSLTNKQKFYSLELEHDVTNVLLKPYESKMPRQFPLKREKDHFILVVFTVNSVE